MFADIKKGQLCDSISQNQELQIINFKQIVINDKEQISLLNDDNAKVRESLEKTKKVLAISKKVSFYGIPAALIVGFIVGSR
jgi:hypothetical protein